MQVAALLRRGEENRHTGRTDFNERSSRSHSVFQIVRPLLLPSLHYAFNPDPPLTLPVNIDYRIANRRSQFITFEWKCNTIKI